MQSGSGNGASEGPTLGADVRVALGRRYQHMLDRISIYPIPRWLAFAAGCGLYWLRVWSLGGWYIVTYGLGIYLLNLFIGFITPQADPETELLPTKQSDDYKPFGRKLPEFKFWQSAMKALLTAFFMTFSSLFNIPVFWPILLVYFVVLFTLTMKNQIAHMIKYKYLPFTWGKKTYAGKGKKPTIDKPSIAAATEPRFTPSNIK